jgi:FkbM family methyltransferase
MPVTCPDADLELLQAGARLAPWLVLVAPLPAAQKKALLEAAAASGRPVLLIDPQLEAKADLASQLALEAPQTLVACSELLAAEAGEQTWFLYNDRRRNGTAAPDALLLHWPNLRLEGQKLRPTRRLDALLSTWLEQAVADGSQPGLLWLPATQATQVLAGTGVFLERLATIWLEGEALSDGLDAELVDRLEASCHRLERDGPKHQLWRLDGQRLVERELLLVTQQLEALQERCEELEVQLSAQVAQTTEQSQQREVLQVRIEELEGQLSAQAAQTAEQSQQREVLQVRVEELEGQLSAQAAQTAEQSQQREVLQVRVEELLSQYGEKSSLNSKSREVLGGHLDEVAIDQFKSLAASAIATILAGEYYEGLDDAAFGLDLSPPSFRPAFELSPSRSGAIFHHPGSDLIGTALKIYGEWAHNEIELLLSLIDFGCCVYDVGAFVGTHSLAFAERVGPSGKVFAFEPNKFSFWLLAMNTCTERRANIRSFNLAIGASNGFVKSVSSDKTNLGLSVLQEAADEFDRDGVLLKSLDSLGLDSDPSLIKIDVEGMELDVLEGAAVTIARSRPFIYAEVNTVAKALALLGWSRENNYDCLGCSHLAFNPGNFALNSNNIYGNGRECALLLIASENLQCQKIQDLIEGGFAKPVANADDLAHLLLTKPQYVAESAWP